MKKIYTISLLLLVVSTSFTFQSCDKIKDRFFPGFETQPTDLQFTIPVIASTAQQGAVGTITTYFNMDSIIKAETLNAFSIRNVDHISVQELELTIQNGDNSNNFGNMENLSVSFYSNANPNQVVVATAPVVADENISEITLVPDVSANLRGYMNGNQLTYTISGKARRVTSKSLTCLLHVRLKMK